MTDQIFYTEGAKNSFFLTFSKNLGFNDLKLKALDLSLDPDGYVLAPKTSKNEAEFVFYNKNSSLVDFCGNALRATGLCFFDQFGEKKLKLSTAVGEMSVEIVSENVIKAQMPNPNQLGVEEIEGVKAQYILSGVPHLVFNLNDLNLNFENKDEIKAFCHRVRSLNLKDKKETFNLTFYKLKEDDTEDNKEDDTEKKDGKDSELKEDGKDKERFVDCVTFERGVEDFTQACGSGALSVYQVFYQALDKRHSNIKMPGGLLSVYREGGFYYMEGPATIMKRIEPS